MTTDLGPKEAAAHVETADGAFSVGGMAKGAGMIEPMLATMLGVRDDGCVGRAAACCTRALNEAVATTFNAITVDGECSTNDTIVRAGERRERSDGHGARNYPALVDGSTAVSAGRWRW